MPVEILYFIDKYVPSIYSLYGFIMYIILVYGFLIIVALSKKYRYLWDGLTKYL